MRGEAGGPWRDRASLTPWINPGACGKPSVKGKKFVEGKIGDNLYAIQFDGCSAAGRDCQHMTYSAIWDGRDLDERTSAHPPFFRAESSRCTSARTC